MVHFTVIKMKLFLAISQTYDCHSSKKLLRRMIKMAKRAIPRETRVKALNACLDLSQTAEVAEKYNLYPDTIK